MTASPPDCSELTSIHEDEVDGAKVIRVDVKKGYRLFHIKKYGHSSKGCYRRFGSRRKSMTKGEIDRRYRASVPKDHSVFVLSKTNLGPELINEKSCANE